jgi:murein DD-endopeptidase MepM/ murein hydrolase activator NlpD
LQNEATNMDLPAGADVIVRAIGSTEQITSGYGYRPGFDVGTYHNGQSFHYGLDFANLEGTVMYAPYPGNAAHIDLADGNQTVKLTLSNGVAIWFLHLSEQLASGPVAKGTALGKVGNTGQSSGAHLHLEFTAAGGSLGGPMSGNIPPEWWSCQAGGATAVAPVVSNDKKDTFETAGAGVPSPWLIDNAARAGDWSVTNEKRLASVLTVSTSRLYQVASLPNGSVQSTFVTAPTGGSTGMVWRYVDGSNYWWVRCASDGKLVIGKLAGSSTVFTSTVGGCVSGAVVRVSFDGAVHTAFINGTQVLTVTDVAHQSAVKVGFGSSSGAAGLYDNWQYTESTAGVYAENTEGVPGTTEPEDTGSSGSWNPIAWLWDRVKGVLVPSESDWEEVTAAFNALTDKEPMGTVKDVGTYWAGLRVEVLAAINGTSVLACSGMAAAQLVGGPYEGVMEGLEPGCIVGKTGMSLDPIADRLEGMALLGSNALLGIKAVQSLMVFLALFTYVRSRIVLAV